MTGRCAAGCPYAWAWPNHPPCGRNPGNYILEYANRHHAVPARYAHLQPAARACALLRPSQTPLTCGKFAPCTMYRAVGFRVHLTHSQRLRIHKIRMGQRFVYDWAIERLQRDPTPTAYDLQKELAGMRRTYWTWGACAKTPQYGGRGRPLISPSTDTATSSSAPGSAMAAYRSCAMYLQNTSATRVHPCRGTARRRIVIAP